MAADEGATALLQVRSVPTLFETVITCNPPILESLLAQVPTETILRLYQTSYHLRQFLEESPTSWRYLSFRLFQPAATTATVTNNAAGTGPRQSSNYALDQLFMERLNRITTRLTSLELDNTAVSGATLVGTVLTQRRDTLQHLSVRGCKNVSLKYHINPWLQMHVLARRNNSGTPDSTLSGLALKSLYTYRCRHHRRRPYLPASLVRKESDSEPTHELVTICHTLGIWTDTAWCTSPGPRCYRRSMYVTSRIAQDSREVWVVYDRLWRSKNWLGPPEGSDSRRDPSGLKRKRDGKFWEHEENAVNGEPLGGSLEGKSMPTHLRHSHRRFVETIVCDNCSEVINERCESCSVMMHCAGCRKTLCASCAFDRPFVRNKNALPEERNKFWWAPGCAVSPCSMLDQDLPPTGPNQHPQNTVNTLPSTKFKWCCTEPVFSGGGGITFSSGNNRDTDRIRAAPLPSGQGWEDPDFCSTASHASAMWEDCQACSGGSLQQSPSFALAGRWTSIEEFFEWQASAHAAEDGHLTSVPRSLCDDCYASEHWNVKCKGCASPLCVKHDVRDRLKFRVCGYKDLVQERQDFKLRQKALKSMEAKLATFRQWGDLKRNAVPSAAQPPTEVALGEEYVHISRARSQTETSATFPSLNLPTVPGADPQGVANISFETGTTEALSVEADLQGLLQTIRSHRPMTPLRRPTPARPQSRGSNATDTASRSSSPAPDGSLSPEPSDQTPERPGTPPPQRQMWEGCQSFFCPPNRLPGDRRRRCAAAMRQCSQCKVHVCSGCVTSLGASCPCKGCRVPQAEEGSSQLSSDSALFFCPNCRWDRMVTGKCKRKTEAFISALSEIKKKPRKRRDKIKKPLNERRGTDAPPSGDAQNDAVEGLADFFATLNTSDDAGTQVPIIDVDDIRDLSEIRDVGVLARDLIRRIQSLRTHFRPGSAGAMALPDIRLEDLPEVQETTQEESSSSDDTAAL